MGVGRRVLGILLCFCLGSHGLHGQENAASSQAGLRVAHVFVALCDNKHQGILPVPEKIGNGQDPARNLYWGNSEGVAGWFGASKTWKRLHTLEKPTDAVLERRIYLHKDQKCLLVADAYDGACMQACLNQYFASVAGKYVCEVPGPTGAVPAGGGADLVAFLGHNGLMELKVSPPEKIPKMSPKATVVLACQSAAYFLPLLKTLEAKPLLLTQQNMYPGSFLLDAALQGWLAEKKPQEIRQAAGAAYAKNQKLKQKAALGVFWTPTE